MAWEDRNGRQYYYKKRREGRRVVSEYYGSGEFAVLLAELDYLVREKERANRRAEQHKLDGWLAGQLQFHPSAAISKEQS